MEAAEAVAAVEIADEAEFAVDFHTEAETGIEQEILPEDPAGNSLFELQDGRWMATIQTTEGETLEVELLAHDQELQTQVLSLEIGNEIVNQADGVNLEGEPVTFVMTYARTELGIVATPEEIPRTIDPEPIGLLKVEGIISNLKPEETQEPPLIAFATETSLPEEPEHTKPLETQKSSVTQKKGWWESGQHAVKPVEAAEPVTLIDFLEQTGIDPIEPVKSQQSDAPPSEPNDIKGIIKAEPIKLTTKPVETAPQPMTTEPTPPTEPSTPGGGQTSTIERVTTPSAENVQESQVPVTEKPAAITAIDQASEPLVTESFTMQPTEKPAEAPFEISQTDQTIDPPAMEATSDAQPDVTETPVVQLREIQIETATIDPPAQTEFAPVEVNETSNIEPAIHEPSPLENHFVEEVALVDEPVIQETAAAQPIVTSAPIIRTATITGDSSRHEIKEGGIEAAADVDKPTEETRPQSVHKQHTTRIAVTTQSDTPLPSQESKPEPQLTETAVPTISEAQDVPASLTETLEALEEEAAAPVALSSQAQPKPSHITQTWTEDFGASQNPEPVPNEWYTNEAVPQPAANSAEAFGSPVSKPSIVADDNEEPDITIDFDTDERRQAPRRRSSTRSTSV